MIKTKNVILSIVLALFLPCLPVMASEIETQTLSGKMTTINVSATDNEEGDLLYAIDSDDPEAFSTNSYFTVKEGSTHTVYVKDAAGNISSSTITAPVEKVGIEITLGNTDSTDSPAQSYKDKEAAEAGGGTLYESTITNGSSNSEKVFYTITTKAGNVFYMIVDNSRADGNVYLLDQVTEEELLAFTGAEGKKSEEKENINFFNSNFVEETVKDASDTSSKKEPSNNSMLPVIIIVAVVGGGVYYYLKVYKPKKMEEADLSDAMDLEEFATPEDEEEDEDDIFNVDQEEKDRLLKSILDPDDNEDNDSEDYLNKSLYDFEEEIDEKLAQDNMHEAADVEQQFYPDEDDENMEE